MGLCCVLEGVLGRNGNLDDAFGDDIEQVGIQRTHRELERADLILEVVDASLPPSVAKRVSLPQSVESRRILLLNKADLGIAAGWESGVALSCAREEGVETLRDAIRDIILLAGPLMSDHPVAINTRHKICFEKLVLHVETARSALSTGTAPEYVALDLREALAALGEVVGVIDVEQILDVIFSSFCIGK
jgi:tRNA modification GTPase